MEPARRRQCWMPHQAVQLLAVHAPQGVQGVLRGDQAIVSRTIAGLTVEVRVPGKAGRRAGYRAAGGSLPVGLSLHQNHRVQRGDGNSWEGGGIGVTILVHLIFVVYF